MDGLDRKNGEAREVWIESSSQDDVILQAGDLHMVVSTVTEDPPYVISQPIRIVLDKQQPKTLRVSESKIAWGVFFGLLLWAIIGIVITALFWGLIIAGLAAAAGGGLSWLNIFWYETELFNKD